jgi:hypothetical protein
VVRELGDETLVYDLDTDAVHCLTGATASVWRAAARPASVRSICKQTGLDERDTLAAVLHLGAANLLTADGNGMSRRHLIQRAALVGGGAVAMPVINSILAPSPAAAYSFVPSPGFYDLEAEVASFIAANGVNVASNSSGGRYTHFLGAGAVKTTYTPGSDFTASQYYATLVGPPTQSALSASAQGSKVPAGTYYYVITATTSAGQTTISNEQSITLSASSVVTLTWSAVEGATGYRIYRSTTSGSYTNASSKAVAAGTTATDNDSGLAAATPPGTNGATLTNAQVFAGSAYATGARLGAPVSGANLTVTVTPTLANYVVIGFTDPGTSGSRVAKVTYTATGATTGRTTIQIVKPDGTLADTQTTTASPISRSAIAVTTTVGGMLYVVIGANSATAPTPVNLKLQVA